MSENTLEIGVAFKVARQLNEGEMRLIREGDEETMRSVIKDAMVTALVENMEKTDVRSLAINSFNESWEKFLNRNRDNSAMAEVTIHDEIPAEDRVQGMKEREDESYREWVAQQSLFWEMFYTLRPGGPYVVCPVCKTEVCIIEPGPRAKLEWTHFNPSNDHQCPANTRFNLREVKILWPTSGQTRELIAAKHRTMTESESPYIKPGSEKKPEKLGRFRI